VTKRSRWALNGELGDLSSAMNQKRRSAGRNQSFKISAAK